jgi:asparagine synthetase A
MTTDAQALADQIATFDACVSVAHHLQGLINGPRIAAFERGDNATFDKLTAEHRAIQVEMDQLEPSNVQEVKATTAKWGRMIRARRSQVQTE